MSMFGKTARYYDLIYQSRRDPEADVDAIVELVGRFKESPGVKLLDVACGTGIHIPVLQNHYGPVEGLDLDAGLLAIARERCPDVPLHQMDMVGFSLDRQYDIITCLFSSIGYAGSVDRLER
ncbi:MAG: class I SAM-dependent DNA methyltransferase, partial [Chloroflexota bacterium]